MDSAGSKHPDPATITTLDEHWRDLSRCIYGACSPGQLRVLRQAFYAGALSYQRSFMLGAVDQPGGLVRALDRLDGELTRFESGLADDG